MKNDQSFDVLLAEFERGWRSARLIRIIVSVIGFGSIVALLFVGVNTVQKSNAAAELQVREKNIAMDQLRLELDSRSQEISLTKSELDNSQLELTKLQESIKTGTETKAVIANLELKVAQYKRKLGYTNDQVATLTKALNTIQKPDANLDTLTAQFVERENTLSSVRSQLLEKEETIKRLENSR
jgi:chromosome segregation ATPase